MALGSRWDRKLRFWTRDRLTFPFGRSCRRGVILSDIAVYLPQCKSNARSIIYKR
jgi:hypothetical protein